MSLTGAGTTKCSVVGSEALVVFFMGVIVIVSWGLRFTDVARRVKKK